MTTLLTTLATKLAEKWMTLVVLPGLLLLAMAFAGTLLGHRGWADGRHLVDEVNRIGKAAGGAPAATLAVVLVALLLASVALGILAQAAGAGLRWLWTINPRDPNRRPFWDLTTRRQSTWDEIEREYRAALEQVDQARIAADDAAANYAAHPDSVQAQTRAELAENDVTHARNRAAPIAARRNRIALARPSRPTWMGDRLAAVETRVRGQYGLDLPAVWPRLQLVVPDGAKADLRSAADAFARAGALAGWGLLYLLVTVVWWPAAPIGILVMIIGWRRGRAAVAALTDLTESAVDLYAATLAKQLGSSQATVVTPALGKQITEQLRKGT